MCRTVFNICVLFAIWGSVRCKSFSTDCTTLNALFQSKKTTTQISCDDPSRVLFISKQDFVCTELRVPSSCVNQHLASCFRSVPSDIDTSYIDYFTFAEKCNNANSCQISYSDYDNVSNELIRTVTDPCGNVCIKGKYSSPTIVYYECIQSTRIIDMGSSHTFNILGTIYIQSVRGTSASCQIDGEIESSRILEQSNSDVIITSQDGFTKFCSDVFKSFNYNENLDCLKKATNIKVNVTGNENSKFGLELSGKQLYVRCGDETIISENGASTEEGEFPLIEVIVGVILLVVISILVVIVICIKKSKSMTSNNVHYQKDNNQVNILSTSPTQINQESMYYNDADVQQNRRNEAAGSVPVFLDDDVYNTINETEGNNVKETPPPGVYDCTEGDYSDIGQVPESRNMVQQDEKTKSGEQTVTKQESTGDVYAVVCKDNKLAENCIVGPQGDVYATVSNVKHHT